MLTADNCIEKSGYTLLHKGAFCKKGGAAHARQTK